MKIDVDEIFDKNEKLSIELEELLIKTYEYFLNSHSDKVSNSNEIFAISATAIVRFTSIAFIYLSKEIFSKNDVIKLFGNTILTLENSFDEEIKRRNTH